MLPSSNNPTQLDQFIGPARQAARLIERLIQAAAQDRDPLRARRLSHADARSTKPLCQRNQSKRSASACSVMKPPGADLMAPLVGWGQHLALQDIWLAGVALGRNLTLVTRNRRDFDRITGLKVENWFE